MTITDVCNLALDRAGIDQEIADYANDPTDLARMLRRHYPIAAEYVLRRHPWKDAVMWAQLGPAEYTKSYTGAATNNDAGDADFVVQEAIEAFTPSYGIITIDSTDHEYVSWDTSTFTLKSGTTLAASYDANDTVTIIPNNYNAQYEYMYALPSDLLEALELEEDDQLEFEVQGGYIYTNEYDGTYGIKIRYIYDIRDEVSSVTVYANHVGDAIAAELAWRAAPRGAKDLIALLYGEKEQVLNDMIAQDARGKMSEPEERTRWVDTK